MSDKDPYHRLPVGAENRGGLRPLQLLVLVLASSTVVTVPRNKPLSRLECVLSHPCLPLSLYTAVATPISPGAYPAGVSFLPLPLWVLPLLWPSSFPPSFLVQTPPSHELSALPSAGLNSF